MPGFAHLVISQSSRGPIRRQPLFLQSALVESVHPLRPLPNTIHLLSLCLRPHHPKDSPQLAISRDLQQERPGESTFVVDMASVTAEKKLDMSLDDIIVQERAKTDAGAASADEAKSTWVAD